jgi:hypothetical protein
MTGDLAVAICMIMMRTAELEVAVLVLRVATEGHRPKVSLQATEELDYLRFRLMEMCIDL